MSMAKTVNITSGAETRVVSGRRSLFGGAAAVVLGGGITAGVAASVADLVPNDTADAVLLAICARAEEQDRMCELPCTTLAGVQALARALATWDRELLKDGPAKDLGELITSCMVERLLALPHPDADLLAVCSEFCASEAAFTAIYADDQDDDDEAHNALAAPIQASWDGMLDRMAQLQATTSEGLAARALALAQHSGIKPGTSSYPFAFNPNAEATDVPSQLLHMLLSDASRMIGELLPVLDADLLALRPEFDRLHAVMIDYNTPGLIPDGGTECADFDTLCDRIATAVPAIGLEGRAFQAAAAMHHLHYRLNDCEQERNPAWLMLKGIAGDAYQSVEGRG